MYIAGVKYILGLDIKDGYMSFNPSISSEWKEYSIRYKFGESIYNIKVENSNHKMSGVKQVILNGIIVEDKIIKLQNNGSVNEVIIIM